AGIALARGLEQLNRIAVRIEKLDLLPARSDFHPVAERDSSVFERRDRFFQLGDAKDNAVPAAGFLAVTVGHRPGTGSFWTAQQEMKRAERKRREGRQLLMLHFETEVLGVERHGATDVAGLIPDSVKIAHELPRRFAPLADRCR